MEAPAHQFRIKNVENLDPVVTLKVNIISY